MVEPDGQRREEGAGSRRKKKDDDSASLELGRMITKEIQSNNLHVLKPRVSTVRIMPKETVKDEVICERPPASTKLLAHPNASDDSSIISNLNGGGELKLTFVNGPTGFLF